MFNDVSFFNGQHNIFPVANDTFGIGEESALCHEHLMFCFLLPRAGKRSGVVLSIKIVLCRKLKTYLFTKIPP